MSSYDNTEFLCIVYWPIADCAPSNPHKYCVPRGGGVHPLIWHSLKTTTYMYIVHNNIMYIKVQKLFFPCDVLVGCFTPWVLLQDIKERVKLLFIQETNTRLNNLTRAVFYKHIYTTFEYQYYLKKKSIYKKYKSAMSRLRMSSHRFHMETGRWTSTDLTDRICSYCNTLENEFHFFFECNLYNDLRKTNYWYDDVKWPDCYKKYCHLHL